MPSTSTENATLDPIALLFSSHQRRLIKEDDRTPLYHKLYLLLKNAIVDGTLPNGTQMPTELQLAEAFDFSRITAKRAMDELAADGLVERQRGKGTHVTYKFRPRPVAAPLTAMLEELEILGRHTQAKVLECQPLQPPGHIRDEFGLAPGASMLRLIRVRLRDGKPFGYYRSWTLGMEDKVSRRQLENAPRLELFREQGLVFTHVTQMISAIAAPAEVAAELDTEPGAPLLSLLRRSYNNTGKREILVDRLQALYNPERFQYRMDLKV
ncbi:MAG: GntR family transcriptional regulator [Xanthomonadales bacterium]|nr:GntR family transcriptional regulator [Xanthomonadales bacterium]